MVYTVLERVKFILIITLQTAFIPTVNMHPNNHMCARVTTDLSEISKTSNFVMKNMSVSYTSKTRPYDL